MRGLVTAGPVFVLGFSLSQSRGLVPPNQIESCPDLPPRPPLCNGDSRSLPFPVAALFAGLQQTYAAAMTGCAIRAMAQLGTLRRQRHDGDVVGHLEFV